MCRARDGRREEAQGEESGVQDSWVVRRAAGISCEDCQCPVCNQVTRAHERRKLQDVVKQLEVRVSISVRAWAVLLSDATW